MLWGMQILIGENWHWVSKNIKPPYQYETEEEAIKMLSIYYPEQFQKQKLGGSVTVRVQGISDA